MTIYVLKINCDYEFLYSGFEDTKIVCYNDYSRAKEKFKEELEIIKNEFIRNGYKEEEMNISLFNNDSEFSIDNDRDFYSARIEKHQVI